MTTLDTIPAPEQSIEIAAVTRLKHAVLWDAAREIGGHEALAKHLGVSTATVANWVNLRTALGPVTGKRGSRRFSQEKREEIAVKLCKLTGKHIKELFPEFLVDALPLLARVKEQRQRVSAQRLRALTHHGERTADRLTWDANKVDRKIDRGQSREAIGKVLKKLSYREREVLKLRFGLGEDGFAYTYKEVGHIFKMTRERIRQIEAKAIRKLQHPKLAASLVAFVAND